MQCAIDEESCVWKSTRTATVRTIVECCYPYFERKAGINPPERGTAVILCPPEEHDLGARMAADFYFYAATTRFSSAAIRHIPIFTMRSI